MASYINVITSAGGGIALTGDSSGVLSFQSAGTTYMTMDASGNLGIGTASPSAKLQVNGAAVVGASAGGGIGVAGDATTFTPSGASKTIPNYGFGDIGGGIVGAAGYSGLTYYTNQAERMRIDTSGNVGIGVTPSAWNSRGKAIQLGNGSINTSLFSLNSGLNGLANNMYVTASTDNYISTGEASRYYQYAGTHVWDTATSGTAGNTITFTERMRIDSSGKVSIGSATTTYAQLNSTTSSDFQASLNATNAAGYSSLYFTLNDAQKGAIYQEHGTTRLYVRCNSSGGVYLASGGTSWTAVSDERIKTDLKPIEDAANKVSTLRAVTGRYITDEEGTSRSFLIAQDVQKVLPEAVDANDPDKLGVQYSDTIPLLVAAIKEQQELIKQLQADVAALKGAK